MRYRQLGSTGFEVSEVGMGCWAIGGATYKGATPSGWAGVDEWEALSAVQKAREVGVNFFDTADVYGRGKSEVLVNLGLKGYRDQCVICTKGGVGIIFTPVSTGLAQDFSYNYIMGAIDASLCRLGTEYVEVYLLHNPPSEAVKEGKIFQAVRDLKKEGKIKSYGISARDPEDGIEAMKHGAEAIEVVYNILNQEAAKRLFPLALENGVGIIVREALQRGLLTGKYDEDTIFPKSDHRSASSMFYLPDGLKKEIRKVKKLKPIFEEEGVESMAQGALKFVLSQKAVSTVIPGAKNQKQVMENAKASDEKLLSAKALERIDELYQNNFYLDSP